MVCSRHNMLLHFPICPPHSADPGPAHRLLHAESERNAPYLPKIPVIIVLPDNTSMSLGWEVEHTPCRSPTAAMASSASGSGSSAGGEEEEEEKPFTARLSAALEAASSRASLAADASSPGPATAASGTPAATQQDAAVVPSHRRERPNSTQSHCPHLLPMSWLLVPLHCLLGSRSRLLLSALRCWLCSCHYPQDCPHHHTHACSPSCAQLAAWCRPAPAPLHTCASARACPRAALAAALATSSATCRAPGTAGTSWRRRSCGLSVSGNREAASRVSWRLSSRRRALGPAHVV